MGLSLSLGIGASMAAFHYPNTVLEAGDHVENAPLEFAADILQPALFAYAVAYFPFDMKWWGNTTLGTYCVHFYFLGQMMMWARTNLPYLGRLDKTGILCVLYCVGTAVFFTTFLGPI